MPKRAGNVALSALPRTIDATAWLCWVFVRRIRESGDAQINMTSINEGSRTYQTPWGIPQPVPRPRCQPDLTGQCGCIALRKMRVPAEELGLDRPENETIQHCIPRILLLLCDPLDPRRMSSNPVAGPGLGLSFLCAPATA